MKRLRRFWRAHWRTACVLLLCMAVVAALLLYRLGSLNGGLSNTEIQLTAHDAAWRNLIDNPLDLPLKSIQLGVFTLLPHYGQTLARLPSVFFGLLSIWALAYVLRNWYGVRTAIFGTILFAFSNWFLHAARLASFDIMYVWGLLALIAVHIMIDRAKRPTILFLAVALTTLILYIPGMIWLIALNFLLQWRTVFHKFKLLARWWQKTIVVLIFLVLVALLVWAFWQNPSLIRIWLGAPAQFASVTDILRALAHIPWYVFYRTPAQPELWLVRAPLLDIFSSVMFGLGAFFYIRHWRAQRTRLLAGFIAFGAALFALGGPVSLSILLPVIYIVLMAGLAYLLHEWFRVFPINPLARGVGLILLSCAVALVCLYHVRSYFVAWPHDPTTIAVFQRHLIQ